MKLLTALAVYEITDSAGSIWNYWQRWQYMKLLIALAVYEITDSTGSIWNYWQRWQYMKLLTALAVYEITDSTGSIQYYWQQWEYMKLLTVLAVYEITDSNGTAERMIIFFVASIVPLLFWENLFWEHSTVLSQGSAFLREVEDGLPSGAASYTSRSHTLAFINSKPAEWKL